jgi:hypothetical protein
LRKFFQKRLRGANPEVGILGDKHGTLAFPL